MSKTLFAQLYKAKAVALAAKILYFDLGSDFLEKKKQCAPHPPIDSTDLKKKYQEVSWKLLSILRIQS